MRRQSDRRVRAHSYDTMQQLTSRVTHATSDSRFWMYSRTPPNTAVSKSNAHRSGRGGSAYQAVTHGNPRQTGVRARRNLPGGCTYIPSDLVDRGQPTLVCDLNVEPPICS